MLKYNRHLFFLFSFSVLIFSCADVDYGAPRVMGFVDLHDSIDPTQYVYLEMVFRPIDNAEYLARWSHNEPYRSLIEVESVSFPRIYGLGGSMGGSDFDDWVVRAWLAMEEGQDGPLPGEPFGYTLVDLNKCANGNRCVDVDVFIEIP